jgi:hypothetical protein
VAKRERERETRGVGATGEHDTKETCGGWRRKKAKEGEKKRGRAVRSCVDWASEQWRLKTAIRKDERVQNAEFDCSTLDEALRDEPNDGGAATSKRAKGQRTTA